MGTGKGVKSSFLVVWRVFKSIMEKRSLSPNGSRRSKNCLNLQRSWSNWRLRVGQRKSCKRKKALLRIRTLGRERIAGSGMLKSRSGRREKRKNGRMLLCSKTIMKCLITNL